MSNYVLEILDGDRAGEVLPVTDRGLRIGRKPGNDVVLPDEKTSGVHCEIVPEGDRYVLRDLGSTNGTFLDGKRVTELVLTPGDVVTVGRLRVRFRSTEEAAPADAGEFAVRKLDSARLQRRGGSTGLLLVLVLLVAAGGGFWWWQNQQEVAAGDGNTGTKRRAVMEVAGNKLEAPLAGCEQADGWQLGVAGVAFASTTAAHTGSGAFEVSRNEEADAGGAPAADFGVMALAKPVSVFAGRTMTIAAHVHTVDGARIGVRAHALTQGEPSTFHFVSGTALQASEDGWSRIECAAVVPQGCDRLNVEVVALLPGNDARAMVDDIAIVEGGTGESIELRHEDSGQSAHGFGSALAIRSRDQENPATLLSVTPGSASGPFAGLEGAGLLTMSDVGAKLTCSAAEHGFALRVDGLSSLTYVFPGDAAGGLLAAGEDGRFRSVAAASTFTSARVLVGSHATRLMLVLPAPAEITGTLAGGLYRLRVGAAEAELQLGFRDQRNAAGDLLRSAGQSVAEGQPGKALDALTELFATAPMDSELLAKAEVMRAELLTAQADQLRRLEQDLDEAGFFSTRGGFERVVDGVDELVHLYGKHNLEDEELPLRLRAAAQARLDQLDAAVARVQRERLSALATAFAGVEQPGLQKLVEDYIAQRLPKPASGAGADATPGGNNGR